MACGLRFGGVDLAHGCFAAGVCCCVVSTVLVYGLSSVVCGVVLEFRVRLAC